MAKKTHTHTKCELKNKRRKVENLNNVNGNSDHNDFIKEADAKDVMNAENMILAFNSGYSKFLEILKKHIF